MQVVHAALATLLLINLILTRVSSFWLTDTSLLLPNIIQTPQVVKSEPGVAPLATSDTGSESSWLRVEPQAALRKSPDQVSYFKARIRFLIRRLSQFQSVTLFRVSFDWSICWHTQTILRPSCFAFSCASIWLVRYGFRPTKQSQAPSSNALLRRARIIHDRQMRSIREPTDSSQTLSIGVQ